MGKKILVISDNTISTKYFESGIYFIKTDFENMKSYVSKIYRK